MKRKTAKEILADSFREIAENKTVDKITIRDITKNCGYSPATFYRQFKDKYDLIAWDYTRDLEEILEKMQYTAASWKQTLLDIALYYEAHKGYLANLFLHTTGIDSFVKNMTEIHCEKLEKWVKETAGTDELDETIIMLIRLYCIGTVMISCEWILDRHPVSAEKLAEVYEKSCPEALCRIIPVFLQN